MLRLETFVGGPLHGEQRLVNGNVYGIHGTVYYVKRRPDGPFEFVDPVSGGVEEPAIDRMPWWARPAEEVGTPTDRLVP